MTLGSVTTSLSGATSNPQKSAPVYKRLGGNSTLDRWKLHSNMDEFYYANLISLDTALVFDSESKAPI